MEHRENSQGNITPAESMTSKTFIFSAPNILNLPNPIKSEVNSEASDTSIIRKNVFTFATPTSVSRINFKDLPIHQTGIPEKQYKPKISRHSFKPAVNVFAQALKDTTMFEKLRKNARSQAVKSNPENSITCTNVPHPLLTKTTAKEYFMMHGNLLKITIRPKKQIIIVTYTTKEEATIAFNKSGEFFGEKFNVEWTKLCVLPKSPTKRKDMQKNIVTNFLKSDDNDIKSELDAMMSLEYNVPDTYRDYIDKTLLKKKKIQKSKDTSKAVTKVDKTSAKSEKHKTDSQISDLLPNASIEELQHIIRQPAYSSEDKYKVLEARDRLMRMKQIKSHTLAAAKTMVGVCPDMCPEKERLMRESKRQLALYEQLEGNEYKINHTVAVKQYSRSSADQEEPMAHDLRPVKSLKMAMSYLLHEIAYLCDQQGTNLGEWYHFLWDRTRGIRKDITQQELCCIDSVELVEQCARFHIVCSERLCAEEPSVFDKKINSDNLTKCLQTLKYMYHDLRVKGINCKNEPEFRAYIILLNLNNSNFMWDLQRLPKSVQKSPEVQLALEVYSALESNNYYKFFKLVHKTTYLNACILLRYFNQVRLRALSVMVKAYCRTTSTAYPLYELIDILGFENECEAIYFCEQVGLNVSKDELHVLLNRQNFSMPILNMKQNRACNVIESKRIMKQLSVGECIAGGKMPEKNYKFHKPHNSFDSHGYLMPDSVNAEDQHKNNVCSPNDPYEYVDEDTKQIKSVLVSGNNKNKSETAVCITEHKNIFTVTTSSNYDINIVTPQKSSTNAFMAFKLQTQITESQENVNLLSTLKTEKQKNANIFSFLSKQAGIVPEETRTSESSAFDNTLCTASTTSKSSNVFSKVLEPPPYSSAALPFTAATNKSIFSGVAQGNIFMRNVTSSTMFPNTHRNLQITSKLSNDTKLKDEQGSLTHSNQVKDIAKVEDTKMKEEICLKKMQQIDQIAKQILYDLEEEIVETYCSDLVEEEINRINICNTLSEDIKNEILTEVTHQICDTILQEELTNTQKLHALLIKIKNRIVKKYFNVWKLNALEKKQRESLDSTPVWLQKYSSDQCAKLLFSEKQNLVIENMCKRHEHEPEITKSYINSLAPIEIIIFRGIKENLKSLKINMLTNYYWKLIISWPDLHNKPILWHYKKIMNQYLCPEDYTKNPIIKIYQSNSLEILHICIRHFEGLISDHHLVGSDALLFITGTSEDTKFVIKRLTKTILSRDRLMPIPLVFIVLGDENSHSVQDTEVVSTLEKLLDARYLSVYTIMHEKDLNEETILNLTQSALLWLTINKPHQNPLEMDYLENIVDVCLTEELWLRIMDGSSFNEKLLCALKEPKFIIDLYNEAVTYLMDIILDPESYMYTKFAPEFKKFIKNEYMMPCSYEYFDDTWKKSDYKAEIETVVHNFKLPQWKYSWPLDNYSIFRQSVTNYCQEALFNADSNEVSCGLLSNLFFTSDILTMSNFIDVLLYIIKKKINLMAKDLKVVYNRNHIKHFRTLPWWFKSNVLNEYRIVTKRFNIHENEKKNEEKNDVNEPISKKQKLYKDKKSDSEVDPLTEYCKSSQNQVMEIHCISKKVEDRLRARQQESLLFEEKLKKALFSKIEST